MTDIRPVQPGEKIKPRLTASWFNRTLPNQPSSTSGGGFSAVATGDRIYAQIDYGSSTVSRYTAIGVKALFYQPDHVETGCIVSTEDTTDKNWGVVQMDGPPEATVEVIMHGLTRAHIYMADNTHKYCYYDVNSRQLVSTADPARGHILVPPLDDGQIIHPGLILQVASPIIT